jgi:hypothetical protein
VVRPTFARPDGKGSGRADQEPSTETGPLNDISLRNDGVVNIAVVTRAMSTRSSALATISARLVAPLLFALWWSCAENVSGLEFFGVHIHAITPTYLPATMPKQLALAKSIGSSMVRIEIPWAWIEARQPGRSYWTSDLVGELDSFLDEAGARGIEVLAVVTGPSPCWASSDPAKNCGTNLVWDFRSPPANVDDYARFLVDLHDFAAGRIHYWEVWNEPNLDFFWKAPDPVAYTSLLMAAYTALKAVDASAVVVAGALTGGGATPDLDADRFLGAMLEAGADPFFDRFSVHPYTLGGPVLGEPPFPGLVDIVSGCRLALVNHGDSRPLWITEVGWPTGPSPITLPCPDCHYWKINSEAEQATNIAFAISTIEGLGYVETLILFELIDTLAPSDPNVESPTQHIGVFRKDFTPKPAAVALQVNRRHAVIRIERPRSRRTLHPRPSS